MRSLFSGGHLRMAGLRTDPRPAHRAAARRIVLLVHLGVVLAIVGMALVQMVTPAPPAQVLLPLHGSLLLLFAWMLVSWRLAWGNLFNPYGMFIGMSVAFLGGYSLLTVMGMSEQVVLLAELTEETMAATLSVVIVGLAGLHLGALCGLNVHADAEPQPLTTEDRHTGPLRYLGWAMLLIALLPMVLDIREAIGAVLSGGYMALYQGGGSANTAESTVLTLMREFFLPGVLFLLAGSRTHRAGRLAAIGFVVLYALTYMFLGKRATAMLPVIALVWLWHVTIRRLPIGLVGSLGAALFLFVAPLVRQVRGLSGADRFSLPTLLESYASIENPIVAILGEMGSTLVTVSYTIDLVPEVRPFEWGMGYVRALLNAFPILDIPTPHPESGAWLAWTMRPEWAANGFGFGYSYVAEAFLNGGWWGTPLFLALLGLGLAGFLRWSLHHGDPARIAVVACFLPDLLFFVRGESISLSRPLFWYALLPYLAVLVWRHIQHRQAPPPPTPPPNAPNRTAVTLGTGNHVPGNHVPGNRPVVDRPGIPNDRSTEATPTDPWAYL